MSLVTLTPRVQGRGGWEGGAQWDMMATQFSFLMHTAGMRALFFSLAWNLGRLSVSALPNRVSELARSAIY